MNTSAIYVKFESFKYFDLFYCCYVLYSDSRNKCFLLECKYVYLLFVYDISNCFFIPGGDVY